MVKRFRGWAFGRDERGGVFLTRDRGVATILSNQVFATHLWLDHYRAGKLIAHRDLGSGLVTNVGVMAMANDFNWAQNCQTLKLANYHGSGTSVTPAAVTDIAIATQAGPTMASLGVQTLISAANVQKYQTVGTVSYSSSLSITEWGLFTGPAYAGLTTGTPFTATGASSATVTGAPYSASSATVQGEQQNIVKPGTTAVYGLITSNTTSVLNVPAWYKVSDGTAGSTPGATEAFTIFPVMWDHRIFSAQAVNAGDAITFTYQLTVNSGG